MVVVEAEAEAVEAVGSSVFGPFDSAFLGGRM